MSSIEVQANEEVTIAIVVHPLNNGVSAAEIQIKYRPETLELLSISLGPFLGSDPIVIVSRIDNLLGEAQFAIVRKGNTEIPTTAGELLSLRWRVRLLAEPGFHSAEIVLAQLANESFEFITNPDAGFILFIVK